MHIMRGESGTVGLNKKAANTPVLRSDTRVFDLSPYHGNIRDAAGGNPHLLSIENVVVPILACARSHASRIRTKIGLGQPKAAQLFSCSHLRQPVVLLLLCAEDKDGIHDERRLHADKAAQPGVPALKFLHQQAVFDVVHSSAAVPFNGCPIEAEFTHGTHQLAREAAVAIALFNDRDEFVVDKESRVTPNEQFIVREKRVKLKEINSLKLEGHSSRFYSRLTSISERETRLHIRRANRSFRVHPRPRRTTMADPAKTPDEDMHKGAVEDDTVQPDFTRRANN